MWPCQQYNFVSHFYIYIYTALDKLPNSNSTLISINDRLIAIQVRFYNVGYVYSASKVAMKFCTEDSAERLTKDQEVTEIDFHLYWDELLAMIYYKEITFSNYEIMKSWNIDVFLNQIVGHRFEFNYNE